MFAEAEAEFARRAAARIASFLARRTDLSPACREMAREQREEYSLTVHCIEQALRIDAEPRARLGTVFAFNAGLRARRAQAEQDDAHADAMLDRYADDLPVRRASVHAHDGD